MDDIDIVREAEEDLKQERYQKLWNDYKVYIISIIAGLVIGTGAVSFYTSWQLDRDRQATAFIQETDDLLDETALETLSQGAEELPSRQAAIAKLIAAGKAITVNDLEKAEALLIETANNDGADPLLRDMAAVNLAGLILRQPTARVEDVETALSRPLSDEDNVWHAHAQFYYALALASKEQRYQEAHEIMAGIKDIESAPSGIIQLAIEISNVYAQMAKDMSNG